MWVLLAGASRFIRFHKTIADPKHVEDMLADRYVGSKGLESETDFFAEKPGEAKLEDLPKKFEVKIVGADDCEDCSLFCKCSWMIFLDHEASFVYFI